MAGKKKVSGNKKPKTREELMEECFELGIPITGDEDEETLKLYLDTSDDELGNEKDDLPDDDDYYKEDEDDDLLKEEPDEDDFGNDDFDLDEDEDDDFLDDEEPPFN